MLRPPRRTNANAATALPLVDGLNRCARRMWQTTVADTATGHMRRRAPPSDSATSPPSPSCATRRPSGRAAPINPPRRSTQRNTPCTAHTPPQAGDAAVHHAARTSTYASLAVWTKSSATPPAPPAPLNTPVNLAQMTPGIARASAPESTAAARCPSRAPPVMAHRSWTQFDHQRASTKKLGRHAQQRGLLVWTKILHFYLVPTAPALRRVAAPPPAPQFVDGIGRTRGFARRDSGSATWCGRDRLTWVDAVSLKPSSARVCTTTGAALR